MKIVSVVGARPNFMKIAPLVKEFKKFKSIKHTLVHTGQHYDHRMSQLFFDQLGIPKPDINLEVGSGSHSVQTAQVMMAFERVLVRIKPDLVVVVGDVNSTMAATLVAAKLHVPVAHVEAGLRSFDRNMPEEINRIVTDSLADILLTTCRDANINLKKEGIPTRKIHFVGNIMIDTLHQHLKKARRTDAMTPHGLEPKGYFLVTLHRPSNVDDPATFRRILDALAEVQKKVKILFPMHPRTQTHFRKIMSKRKLRAMSNLKVIDPVGYYEFLNLMMNAKGVITDSGGIQEETTVLRVPCVTVRENTERPITITQGTNTLAGTDTNKIIRAANAILAGKAGRGRVPRYWDGKTAGRIARCILTLRRKGLV